MELKKIDYANFQTNTNKQIKDSYITLVQDNKFHQVNISAEECEKSVRLLSRLKSESNAET